jgi:hypothetical protein
MSGSTSVIPAGVLWRLILNLCGWRLVDGRYAYGEQSISEEQLDSMSEAAWEAFVALWLVSAN